MQVRALLLSMLFHTLLASRDRPAAAHALIGAVRHSKAFNPLSGAIVPNHSFKPLAPPRIALYRVLLLNSGVLLVCGWVSCWWGTAAAWVLLPGSGYVPTIGIGR